jgi:hypothetical protein
MAMESQTLVLLGVIEGVAEGGKGLQVTVGDTEAIGGRQCEGFTIVETTYIAKAGLSVRFQRSGLGAD